MKQRFVGWSLLFAALATAAAAQEVPASASRVYGFWTNFAASEVAGGGGDNAIEAGGKLDVFGVLGGRDLGFGAGLTLGGHGEFVYGRNVTSADPVFLLPPNTALFLPVNNDQGADLSLALTQAFGAATVTVGKINMIDHAARTPLLGGGGLEGFQHLQFAAPLTNLTPPSVFGALAVVPTRRAILSLGVWDSESAVQLAWPENDFADLNGLLGLTVPVRLRGFPGYQGLQLQATTEETIDLADLPFLAIPPSLRPDIKEAEAGWMVQYAFQQYLWQDAADPERGWGLFGQANVWDGDTTLSDWALTFGVTGVGPLATRPRDRFGLGYFIVSPSDALIASLEALAYPVTLRAEQGVEGFYTWQVGSRWRLTTIGQAIQPGIEGIDTAYVLGLRALVSF